MSDHITAAFHLAWIVGVWHMLIAGYLIFVADRDDRSLMAIALVKGLLGACIYVLIRDPWWATHEALAGVFLPATLLTLYIFSAVVTWLIWQHYRLASPYEKLAALYDRFLER